MKDLVKVQKTLINVFNYLKYKTDTEVSKRLLTEVGDAHRVVENLAVHDVVGSYESKTYADLCKLRKQEIEDVKLLDKVIKDLCAGVGRYTGTTEKYKS